MGCCDTSVQTRLKKPRQKSYDPADRLAEEMYLDHRASIGIIERTWLHIDPIVKELYRKKAREYADKFIDAGNELLPENNDAYNNEIVQRHKAHDRMNELFKYDNEIIAQRKLQQQQQQ